MLFALESFTENIELSKDPILSDKLIQIKEIIKRSSNKNLLISRLINDCKKDGITLNRSSQFLAKSHPSTHHKEVIRNIFLNPGYSNDLVNQASSLDFQNNSLSFGTMNGRSSEKIARQNNMSTFSKAIPQKQKITSNL